MESESNELFRLIPIPMSQTFIQAIDDNLKRLGYNSRAQFLRDAAFEKASKLGIKIPRESTLGARVNSTVTDMAGEKAASAKQPNRLKVDDRTKQMAVRDLVRPVSSRERKSATLPPIDPDTEHGREILAKAGIVAAGLTPSGGSPPPSKAASTSDNRDELSSQPGKASSPETGAPARVRESRGGAKRKTAP